MTTKDVIHWTVRATERRIADLERSIESSKRDIAKCVAEGSNTFIIFNLTNKANDLAVMLQELEALKRQISDINAIAETIREA